METYTSSEYLKVLTEDAIDGDSTIMYVGYADFDGPKAYTGVGDNANPIWKIRKIVTTGALVESYYADGNPAFDNIWDNRAALTYI